MLQLLRVHKGPYLPVSSHQNRDDYSELERLQYNRSDEAVENLLVIIAEKLLKDVRYRIFHLDGNFEDVKNDLRHLADIASRFGKKNLTDEIFFAVNTLWGLLYSESEDWMQAIKSLNNAISICPRSLEGIHIAGLSDSLVLLSESYSSLGKWEDAVHSARLAVVCAHKRMDAIGVRDLGSLLDGSTSLLATYYTLAVMLERSGVSTEVLALEWYTRVVKTASKMIMKHERAQSDIDSVSRSEQQGLEHMHLSEITYNQMINLSHLSEESKIRLQRLSSPRTGFIEESMMSLPRNTSPFMPLPETGLKVRPQSALPRLLSDPTIGKLRTLYPSLSTNFAGNPNDRDSEEDYDNANLSAKEDQGNLAIGTNLQESNYSQMNRDGNNAYNNEREGWRPQNSQHQFSAPTMSSPPPPLYYNADLPQPQFQPHQQQREQQDSDNEIDYQVYPDGNKRYQNINNYRSQNNETFDEFKSPDRNHKKHREILDRSFLRGPISPERLSTLSRNKSDLMYIATACSINRKRGRHDAYNMFAPSLITSRSVMLQQAIEPNQEEHTIRRRQEGRKGRINRLRLELKSLRLGAALLIQRAGRGYISRIIGKALKKQRAFELRRRSCKIAVTAIQRIFRGHQSRARVRVQTQKEAALKIEHITDEENVTEGLITIEAQKTAVQDRSDMDLYRKMVDITRKRHEAATGKQTTAASLESSRGEKDGRKLEGLLTVKEKGMEERRSSQGQDHGRATVPVEGAGFPSPNKNVQYKGNTNAASLRLRNKKDMHQHMRQVFSQISIQKAESSRKMILMRSEKVIVLQALVRGYLERRRHRGLLRHIGRSMDLSKREMSLRKKEETVREYFEGLALSAQEEEERFISRNLPSDSQKHQVNEASVIVDLNGLKSQNTTAGHSELDSPLDSSSVNFTNNFESVSKNDIESDSHHRHNERTSLEIESEQDQSLCLSESGGDHEQADSFLKPVSPDINQNLEGNFIGTIRNDRDEVQEKDGEMLSSSQPLLATSVDEKVISTEINILADSYIDNDVIIDQGVCREDDFGDERLTVKNAIIMPSTGDTDSSTEEKQENVSKEPMKAAAKVPKLISENSILGAIFKKFSFSTVTPTET